MTPAFVVVFALFVLALVALAVISVRWGIRRDRAARLAARGEERSDGAAPDAAPPEGGPKPSRRAGAGEAGSGRRRP
jgi:hypothetical protein